MQRISLLLVITLAAAACGDGGPSESTGPSAPRQLPAPAAELPVDEAPGGVARNAELVDDSDRCSAAVHGLTGEAGLALFDAQAEGYEAMAPLLARPSRVSAPR